MKPTTITTIIITILALLLLCGCALQRTSITQDEAEKEYAPAKTTQTAKITTTEKTETQSTQPAYQEVETVKVNVLMIIAPTDFRDEEYFEPKKVFESRGYEVTTASKVVDEARGKLGARVPIDIDIKDVDVADYDAIVFIGGPGASTFMKDETALQIARDADSQGKIVSAICLAPSILANAGVLKDHEATAFVSEKTNIDLKSKGFTNQPVTVDGNIITGNGPESAKAFGEAVADAISGL
jgi:protease I